MREQRKRDIISDRLQNKKVIFRYLLITYYVI